MWLGVCHRTLDCLTLFTLSATMLNWNKFALFNLLHPYTVNPCTKPFFWLCVVFFSPRGKNPIRIKKIKYETENNS
jgi:hypothetical protein